MATTNISIPQHLHTSSAAHLAALRRRRALLCALTTGAAYCSLVVVLTARPSADAALAALLDQVPGRLEDAQLACELLGVDTHDEEVHEYPALVTRELRDWLVGGHRRGAGGDLAAAASTDDWAPFGAPSNLWHRPML